MPTITVATVSNVRIPEHLEAVYRTAAALQKPCEKLIICPTKPNLPCGFRWETIPEFSGWKHPDSLNQFLIKRLVEFIHTDFVLYVQDDGYARNPSRWTDRFLEYDYVGAPWPSEWKLNNYVGNGGFSLRSWQLLCLCRAGPEPVPSDPEDVHICRTHFDWFLQHKIKYAPVDVAIHFSIESELSQYPRWDPRKSFGFHGKHFLHRANP